MNKDWREQGQEKYLSELKFTKQKFTKYNDVWEHDHCEFCNIKFCEEKFDAKCIHEGYTTQDKYRWICVDCFKDFSSFHLSAGGRHRV